MQGNVFPVYLSLTNTEPLMWSDFNFQTPEEDATHPESWTFPPNETQSIPLDCFSELKWTAWHVKVLQQKVSDTSHIQIIWKALWRFRSVSRYSIVDFFNFPPVNRRFFRMSMLCIIAFIKLTYPASGVWGLFKILCTPWNGWFPEISRDIGFTQLMKQFVTNMSFFSGLFARGIEGRLWHLSA